METLTRLVDLDLSADELWSAITDPAQLSTWLGDSVDIDVRPGGTGVVIDDGITRHLVIDAVSARRLSFTWWEPGDTSTASHVTFSVDSEGDGTSRLTITESLPHASASDRDRWEVRVLSLWACTVAAALVR